MDMDLNMAHIETSGLLPTRLIPNQITRPSLLWCSYIYSVIDENWNINALTEEYINRHATAGGSAKATRVDKYQFAKAK